METPITEELLKQCGWTKYAYNARSTRFTHEDSWCDIEQHGSKYPFVLTGEKNVATHYICHDTTMESLQRSFKQLNKKELVWKLQK
jgi:hypothetical protein